MKHSLTSPRLLPLLILVILASVPGCASTSSTLHAHGTIATQTMSARVDHPIAQDYLEGRPLPADLEELRRAHIADEKLPSASTLTDLTTRYSTDVATLFFLETVSARGPSTTIQREYASVVERLMRTDGDPQIDAASSRLTVVFAPGGLTIVEPGVDHYFDHPDRELRSLALLEVLLKRPGASAGFSDRAFPLAERAAHASLGPEGGDRTAREDGHDR